MIKKEDKPEFIRQIMELFEDFLDEYGIKICLLYTSDAADD